ncbi:MAG TPA: DEAD/DEAH box helicase, partial [Longimicrobium sp.]
MPSLTIDYVPGTVSARIIGSDDFSDSVWNRVLQAASQADADARVVGRMVELPWGAALPVILELGGLRRDHGFTMDATPDAGQRLQNFHAERAAVRAARTAEGPPAILSSEQVEDSLRALGFTRRTLRDFQIADIIRLTALRHGANFSVPGAGKTTVTLAVHLLTCNPHTHLLVVAPKNAFAAWDEVIDDCMSADAPDGNAQPFVRLDMDDIGVDRALQDGGRRFIISYDKLIRIQRVMSRYMARNQVHLVLDESHRIKAGDDSARGRALLGVAALPVRRDILSGTPAPNSIADLQPQLDFLWPGVHLGTQVAQASRPRDVLQNLYVRTTKRQLGLTPPTRHFRHVEMGPAQLILYTTLKDVVIEQLRDIRRSRHVDFIAARRSVMRLLQVATNPVVAAVNMLGGGDRREDRGTALLETVIEEGDSNKMVEAVTLARDLARQNRKTVVWTIFRPTIDRLEALAQDMSPVVLHGGVPAGDDRSQDTREGRIRRFHDDPDCW